MALGKRNRAAGHKWERDIVKELSKLFNLVPYDGKNVREAEIGTTRVFSKALDNDKVDIWIKDNHLDLNLQAKSITGKIDYLPLLESMPRKGNNIVLHRYTEKANSKFINKGEFAIMPIAVLYDLLKQVYEARVF